MKKILLFLDSMITYVVDIPWLLFDRKPKWNDAENCGRLYCFYCGGKLFNNIKE